MSTDDLSANNGRSIPGGIFATTSWTMLLNARDDSPEGHEALEELCRIYWFPVYVLVRRQGFDSEKARDFTQGFFEQLISRKALANIRRERGRFRAYLSQSVKNFLADEWDRTNARKRGSGLATFSLDAEDAEARYLETPAALAPDRLFDRQWAEELLGIALSRLKKEFYDAGKGALIDILDNLSGPNAPTLESAAEKLGMPVNTLKSHLRRARMRHSEIIREVIAETVATPAEVEAELRDLLAAISD